VKRTITLSLALLACGLPLQNALPIVEQAPPVDAREVVIGNTTFATDLYAKLKNEKGNLFFSPYSISSALAMMFAGARDDTAQRMAKVLHFAVPQMELNPAFAALEGELNAVQKKGQVQLSIANSLWPQKGYPFLPGYVGLLKQDYGTSVTPLDYAGDPEAARRTINEWVEQKTNRKIMDLVKPGVLDSLTRLVLANAIYFKGTWASQFDKEQTSDQLFHVASDKDVKCPLMNRKGRYAYAELPHLQVLELPYAGDELSMIVLLPGNSEPIGRLESELTPATLAEWMKGLRNREVRVFLPKFKLTCEFDLKETLVAMGMTDAFSSQADFSGMDGSRSLSISAVLHKAFVDVNEEGTEAAAATTVMVTATAVRAPMTVFRADHPFVFLVRDNDNGSILFLGRVTDPTA